VKVATGTGSFKNAHCNPAATNESETNDWAHVTITEGEETQLTLKNIGNSTLSTKIAGASVVLTATGVECVECMFHNQKEGSGAMDATGSGGHIRYTGVTINTASCKVVKGEVNTEPLKVTTLTKEKAEVSPVTVGGAEAVIKLEPNTGFEKCTLGTSITVTGHADGTAAGAIATFATGAGELKVGEQEATLAGQVTMTAGLTGSSTMNPVALTAT